MEKNENIAVNEKNMAKDVLKGSGFTYYFVIAFTLINIAILAKNIYLGFINNFARVSTLNIVNVLYKYKDTLNQYGDNTWIYTSLVICAFFVFVAIRRNRYNKLFQLSVILYVLDTFLSLVTKEWITVIVHGIFAINLLNGLKASKIKEEIDTGKMIKENPEYRGSYLNIPFLLRLRTMIPYPILGGIITYILLLVIIPLRGMMRFGFEQSIIVYFANAIILAVWPAFKLVLLFSIPYVLGYLSGFRPFYYYKKGINIEELQSIKDKILLKCSDIGFQTAWKDDRNNFISLLNKELYTTPGTGKRFPVRLIFNVNPCGNVWNISFKIEPNVAIYWDTGETSRCKEIGKEFINFIEQK